MMANALAKMEEMRQPLPDTCILCGEQPDVLAAFVPQDPIPWGGKVGKSRIFVYAICEACLALPNSAVAAEQKIVSGSRFN